MPTNIAWTDETWNPIHGCSRVSAGCSNCYAEQLSYTRYGWTDKPWTAENAAENVTVKPDRLEPGGNGYPGQYQEPKRIFVNSMSDVFHNEVPESFIREMFRVMRNYPEHVFQVLTKRPSRAAEMNIEWPANVWMGTSVEDERVTKRLDLLRECDAETLFASFEPLIGSVGSIDLSGFDWVIVGGESGPDYREMKHEWVWPIKNEARRVDAAFFFKQSAAYQNETDPYLRCPDGEARAFNELPEFSQTTIRARENQGPTDAEGEENAQ